MPEKEQSYWRDKEEIAKILQTEPVTYPDPSWGTEHRYSLRDPADPKQVLARLLTYPSRLRVVYRDRDICLTMNRVSYVGPDPEHEGRLKAASITDEAITTFSMDPRGEIFFHRDHRSPHTPEGDEEAPKTEARPADPPKDEEKKEAKNPRVKLLGRLGMDPVIKPTKDGEGEWAELSIAVRIDGQDKPEWHQVIFGKKQVEQVKGFHKGDFVQIVGGQGEREKTLKGPKGPIKKKVPVVIGFSIQEPKKK